MESNRQINTDKKETNIKTQIADLRVLVQLLKTR